MTAVPFQGTDTSTKINEHQRMPLTSLMSDSPDIDTVGPQRCGHSRPAAARAPASWSLPSSGAP
eukprot:5349241-Pyramimonas_sp.AAC.1